MTIPIPATRFADPAPAHRLARAAAALSSHGFAAEILENAAAARIRVRDLIPEGASGRYRIIKPQTLAMDRGTDADEIRRLRTVPDVVVGSVHAVTETGSLAGKRVPKQPTGHPAPSTACSSSTQSCIPGAAPSCCCAKRSA